MKKNCPMNCKCRQRIDSGLEVHKNLLSVCRVPLAGLVEALVESGNPSGVQFSQLVLTYELILVNNSGNDICNLGIHDSLAAIALEESGAGFPFFSSIEIIKCDSTIIPNGATAVIESDGQLLVREESCLPANSTCKIILKLALSAPPNNICEIRHVKNTICVDGCIGDKEIKTIVEESDIWKTESDVSLLIGINVNINVDV